MNFYNRAMRSASVILFCVAIAQVVGSAAIAILLQSQAVGYNYGSMGGELGKITAILTTILASLGSAAIAFSGAAIIALLERYLNLRQQEGQGQ